MRPVPKLRLTLLRDPVHLLALGFGSGLAPVAPGTAGSFIALLPAALLYEVGLVARISIVLAVTLAGIWLCGESARRLACHDHPGIVWDEIAAVLLLTVLLPPGPYWLAGGWVMFRVFDIAKPWPIRDLDHRLHGGLGIMLDDLVAAAFAAVVVRLIDILILVV
jgi:phosphatidylglycerophosphatase A